MHIKRDNKCTYLWNVVSVAGVTAEVSPSSLSRAQCNNDLASGWGVDARWGGSWNPPNIEMSVTAGNEPHIYATLKASAGADAFNGNYLDIWDWWDYVNNQRIKTSSQLQTRLNYYVWSDRCCKCFKVSGAGDYHWDTHLYSGRIVKAYAAVRVVRALPGFARGVGGKLSRYLDDLKGFADDLVKGIGEDVPGLSG